MLWVGLDLSKDGRSPTLPKSTNGPPSPAPPHPIPRTSFPTPHSPFFFPPFSCEVTIGHETVMASVQFFGTPVAADTPFDLAATYGWLDALPEPSADADSWTWVLLQFESPVPCPPDCIFIASRLDTDLGTQADTLSPSSRP